MSSGNFISHLTHTCECIHIFFVSLYFGRVQEEGLKRKNLQFTANTCLSQPWVISLSSTFLLSGNFRPHRVFRCFFFYCLLFPFYSLFPAFISLFIRFFITFFLPSFTLLYPIPFSLPSFQTRHLLPFHFHLCLSSLGFFIRRCLPCFLFSVTFKGCKQLLVIRKVDWK